MPCPHFKIKISTRNKNASVVAQAAYQSAARLFDERQNRTTDYSRKGGVFHSSILLPPNAPSEYADRNTLWNAVDAAEKNWNAQLARKLEIALPAELPIDKNVQLIREYVKEQFVSKGMVADIAVHDPDPPGHNPHAHVMLTMRPMDENGKWMEKSHKEYVLDETGKKIRLPSGQWKSRKVDTVDWNRKENAEIWRHEWEVIQNRFLEENGRQERIDMRSYERQGTDQIPTVHLGPDATAMERRGMKSDLGNLNREIHDLNAAIRAVKNTISRLVIWIEEIREAIRQIEMEPAELNLGDLLMQRFQERNIERQTSWKSGKGIQNAGLKDMQKFSGIVAYLQEHDIGTVDDLDRKMGEVRTGIDSINKRMKEIDRKTKQIETLHARMKRFRELGPIHQEYKKIYWKARKQNFRNKYRKELDEWDSCNRYLLKTLGQAPYDREDLEAEKRALIQEREGLAEKVTPLQEELSVLKDIRYQVQEYLPELTPSREPLTQEVKQERRSVLTRLQENRQKVQQREGGNNGEAREKKEQDRKQKMEI